MTDLNFLAEPLGDPGPSPTSSMDENSGSHMACDDGSQARTPPDDSAPITTTADRFGIYRVYTRKPTYDPSDCGISDSQPGTCRNQGLAPPRPEAQASTPYYHPFSNPTAAAMMVAHHLGGPVQSEQKTDQIARILASLGSELNHLDLSNFKTAVEHKKLDAYLANAPESMFHREDGWQESSVKIRLPLDKNKMLESNAAEFEVAGVFHRDIINVISLAYQSDAVRTFDHIPFKHYWKPSEHAPSERLYGEIFSSQAMLDADDEICRLCLENDTDHSDLLEAVCVPLLLYSDSTHLANFGTASCWPVYLLFGSQSKYVRASPTASACHHIAYMPKVRRFQSFYAIF